MNTSQIKNFAAQSRNILKAGVIQRIQILGFDVDGNLTKGEPTRIEIQGGATLFAGETAVAGAGALASLSSIPFVGPALAVAALASIVAAAASLPKFAEGALAYGPTIGLFGEYPGAASNPEVVAPLNKLQDLIEPASATFGEVVFEIKGRNLVGVAKKLNRLDSRNNG